MARTGFQYLSRVYYTGQLAKWDLEDYLSLLAPTKLYLPIVSELAALSKRNEYPALDLKAQLGS